MYRYDEFDRDFVAARVAQFKDQVERRLTGELTEEQFRPLRLMNGLYLQLHAYMLRVAIPYGTLSSRQLRKLGHIARVYDRGFGHFTTRQNIQYNWPALKDVPRILEELAEVEMHAIQTSGNCIRNVTADHFAGAAADEVADPRPFAEILRQWSSLHPEFSYLPRKFKIAIVGSEHDRAAIQVHDIGLQLKKNEAGDLGLAVYIGGGQGRTPMVAKKIRDFLPIEDMLTYVTAIVRVYNLHGRRDNKYKARIKILVHETGVEELTREIDAEWEEIRHGELKLPQRDIDAIESYFRMPNLPQRPEGWEVLAVTQKADAEFASWVARNVTPHKHPDYAVVTISLKPIGGIPGDASAEQMELVADIAATYSFDEIRVSHEQNLVLPHVAKADLAAVYDLLQSDGLATPNAGLITDIIACPGLDYCALANARSIPVAQRISERFGDQQRQLEIGDLKIKISGCINACGHHHVGHIGILGVEKKGEELYQITLGGSADEQSAIGEITGRGFSSEDVVDAIETVVDTYLALRESPDETFLAAYRRVGMEPFKRALYGEISRAA
ncbi:MULTISPECIES: nitrite/sulfite reductase [Brucella/Ochrobactrum group]|uniref:Nitrite/sulfite reductase n=1 Tax=Brucella pseudintermedia TaxID=370111 RepID=A0ABY5UBY8_9HYPH|nr:MULTISPECIES: nitrite/sulfite reductase [Brucella/Ochrobactrum group]KAB2681853.1 nitrite/sulfite reductase [Brucella pseudintermedia]NKE75975.1 nitrite/sulfite reductase [Ochrobactrum sp. MC-1LL]TWH00454.1 sulfite reductase (NADPH) hemoprotein beta-component [Ochrobactrum sp. J50]UWL59897.1 nitrite/sulfite reductase [Brucella pseudintermedia]WPM80318.1 nitrite/sulfite reductase [Brucella pseudintermedia]